MTMQTTILIQPILFEPDKGIIITLERILLEQFNTSCVVTASPIKEAPDGLFNEQRNILCRSMVALWHFYS
jgi:hypothetical protein